MNKTTRRQVTLGHRLAGNDLDAANRVLRDHGCAEVAPCTLVQLMNSLTPMECGRFTHIINDLTEALEGMEVLEEGQGLHNGD